MPEREEDTIPLTSLCPRCITRQEKLDSFSLTNGETITQNRGYAEIPYIPDLKRRSFTEFLVSFLCCFAMYWILKRFQFLVRLCVAALFLERNMK